MKRIWIGAGVLAALLMVDYAQLKIPQLYIQVF